MNQRENIVLGVCLSLFGATIGCGSQEEQVPPDAQLSISDVDAEPETDDTHGTRPDSVPGSPDTGEDVAASDVIRDAEPGVDAIPDLDTGDGTGALDAEDEADLPDVADVLNDVQDVGSDACVEDVVPTRGAVCDCPERNFRLVIDQCPTNIYCAENVWRVSPRHDCSLEPGPDAGREQADR